MNCGLNATEDAATLLPGQLAAAGQVQEGSNRRAFNQLGVGQGLLAGCELFMIRPGLQLRQQALVFGGHKCQNQLQAAFAFFIPGFGEIDALLGPPGGGSPLNPKAAPEFGLMISAAGNRDKGEPGCRGAATKTWLRSGVLASGQRRRAPGQRDTTRSVAFRNDVTAVDDVAQGDDGIAFQEAGGFEKLLQLGKAAVDVADDEGLHGLLLNDRTETVLPGALAC
jgi:hypothetical protein